MDKKVKKGKTNVSKKEKVVDDIVKVSDIEGTVGERSEKRERGRPKGSNSAKTGGVKKVNKPTRKTAGDPIDMENEITEVKS